MLLVTLIATISLGLMYNHRMNAQSAAAGIIDFRIRTASMEGSKFVFGNYDGQEAVFESIKYDVQDGIFAWSYGGVVYAPVCSTVSACNNLPLHYKDTSFYEIENSMNAARTAIEADAMLRPFFLPSDEEMKDGGTFGLSAYHRT